MKFGQRENIGRDTAYPRHQRSPKLVNGMLPKLGGLVGTVA